jgi:hypothetical protein
MEAPKEQGKGKTKKQPLGWWKGLENKIILHALPSPPSNYLQAHKPQHGTTRNASSFV